MERTSVSGSQMIGKSHGYVIDVGIVYFSVSIGHVTVTSGDVKDGAVQIFQRLLGSIGHRYVSHARIEHDAGFHVLVSEVGKSLGTSAAMSAKHYLFGVNALIVVTALLAGLSLGPFNARIMSMLGDVFSSRSLTLSCISPSATTMYP